MDEEERTSPGIIEDSIGALRYLTELVEVLHSPFYEAKPSEYGFMIAGDALAMLREELGELAGLRTLARSLEGLDLEELKEQAGRVEILETEVARLNTILEAIRQKQVTRKLEAGDAS